MLLTEQVPAPAPTTPPAVPGRAAAALTGALAAGAALAAGELAAAAVHSVTVAGDRGREASSSTASPGRLKQFAVDTFGTNDKPALVTGIVITSILLGAVLGLAARQRWIVAPLGFVAFGLVGLWAMITDPQDSTGDAIFACLVSVLAGIGTFALLWRLATPHAEAPAAVWEPETPTSTAKVRQTVVDRRGFLAGVAGVVVLTGSATALSRRVRSGDSVDTARRTTVLPRPTRSVLPPASQPFEVDGLTPYVVPNGDFYRIDTALLVPQIGAVRLVGLDQGSGRQPVQHHL